MAPPILKIIAPNCHMLALETNAGEGRVELFFSYDVCIAYRDCVRGWEVFNPHYRKFSATTSKHIGLMGVGNYRDAPSKLEFEQGCNTAIAYLTVARR